MHIAKKIINLALLSMMIYSTQSIAKTVNFQFRHIKATTGKKDGRVPFLCMSVYRFGHEAGMDCEFGHQHKASLGLPLGGFLQENVTSGLGNLFGDYDLTLLCRKGSGNEFYITKSIITLIDLKDDGTKEIEISASCPVDADGYLLAPSDIHIVRRK